MDVAHGPETRSAPDHHRDGEHLYMTERVVVSPCAGIFRPEEAIAAPGMGLLTGTTPSDDGDSPVLEVGELVGRVGVTEVRTPFAGAVVNWLADAGDRVQPGQPLLWITGSEEPE